MGRFAFLPTDATELYDIEEPGRVLYYVISSYTPAISTLLCDIPFPQIPSKWYC